MVEALGQALPQPPGGALTDYLLHGPGGEIGRSRVHRRLHSQGISVQGPAARVHDLADRPQGCTIAPGGDGLIHLGHLQGRERDGPEQHGRNRRDAPLGTQPVERLGHLAHPQTHTQVYGRQVIASWPGPDRAPPNRGHDGRSSGDSSIFPPTRRLIGGIRNTGGQRIALGLGERGQIDRRLDQRADRAHRIERPVEACIARLRDRRPGPAPRPGPRTSPRRRSPGSPDASRGTSRAGPDGRAGTPPPWSGPEGPGW